jgi:glycosyltransferase involved in cell wall biosynthesis
VMRRFRETVLTPLRGLTSCPANLFRLWVRKSERPSTIDHFQLFPKEERKPNIVPLEMRINRLARPYYCSITAIVKDEANYIEEWINFHSFLGVEHFFIYDNGSTDDTREILEKYDFVTRISWQPDNKGNAQTKAYVHALKEFGGRSRWMMFIDVDEFIFPTHYTTLSDAFTRYEDLPGLVLPWRIFGYSDHKRRPSGLVIENFTKTVRLPNPSVSHSEYILLRKVKSVVDPTRVKGVHTHIFLTDNGPPLTPSRSPWSKLSPGPPEEDEHILLNHYFTKSEEEFQAKLARGYKMSGNRNLAKKLAMAKAIESYPVEDLRIQRFVPILRARLCSHLTAR